MKTWHKVAVAGSLAAVLGIVLPLQTYLGNAAIFPFPPWRLVPELLGLFAVFAAGLLAIGFLVGKGCDLLRRARASRAHGGGRAREDTSTTGIVSAFFSLLTAALVCVYLESGLLSAGLPELNGGPVAELANRARALADAGIWSVLIIGFLCFARKLAPYLHWISLAVVVLSVAGLADVAARPSSARDRAAECAPGREDASREPGANSNSLSYQPQPTVVANVRYSPTRNILVFVLDSVPGKAAVDVLATNAALCAQFPGFTAFPRNIGMHECTKRGVPGLVTGRFFDPSEVSEADYPMTMYGTNSFVRAAAAAGWAVAFSPDLLPYGATNLPVERRIAREEKRRSRDRLAFLRQSAEVPFLSLFDTVAFRLSPFAFKGPILYSRIRHAVKGRRSEEGFWGERTLYPALAARPVGVGTRPFLGFFHTWGLHPPWCADFATTVTEKFSALGSLFAAYRAAGIYGTSLIVVTSDHGLDQVSPPAGYPPSASAFLMVKPAGADAPFAVSGLGTSHARIAPLVRAALAGAPDPAACARILRDDRPLYRAEVRSGCRARFRDWPGSPAGGGGGDGR